MFAAHQKLCFQVCLKPLNFILNAWRLVTQELLMSRVQNSRQRGNLNLPSILPIWLDQEGFAIIVNSHNGTWFCFYLVWWKKKTRRHWSRWKDFLFLLITVCNASMVFFRQKSKALVNVHSAIENAGCICFNKSVSPANKTSMVQQTHRKKIGQFPFPLCNFGLDFPELLCQNHIWVHWLIINGNS